MKDFANSNHVKNQLPILSFSGTLAAINKKELLGVLIFCLCGFFTILSLKNDGLFITQLVTADLIVGLVLLVAFLSKTNNK